MCARSCQVLSLSNHNALLFVGLGLCGAGTIQAAGKFVQAYRNTPKQEQAAPLIEEQGAWLIMSPIFMLTAVYQFLAFFIMQFLQSKGGIVRCARIDTER